MNPETYSIPQNIISATADVRRMLYGGLIQKSISAVAKLGIADYLSGEPQSISELAEATNTHENSLYRVLRMLAGLGIFKETTNRMFELTPSGELLGSDHPDSLWNFAIMMGEDWLWKNWNEMMYSLETGLTAQEKVHGSGSFDFFTGNREAGRIFNLAMTDISKPDVPAIVEAYDFSEIETLVDIAGGQGKLLAGIIKANPTVKGILFDLPPVIEDARELIQQEEMEQKIEPKSGNFFKSIPGGADAYILKHIVHDWDDEHCLKILKNIRNAMNPDGRILICEMVVPDGNAPSPAKLLDLQMLLTAGGRERTKEEFDELFTGAGFRLSEIYLTKTPTCIIEGRPC